MEERLVAYLRQLWADDTVTVTRPVRLSGGASRETWSFDAVRGGVVLPLILRRDPPAQPRPDGMRREALALTAGAAAGVPVPRLVGWSAGAEELGAPFLLMERVAGETIPRRILRDEAYAAVRPRLAAQCGELLARVHAIPLAGVPGLDGGDPLAETFARYDALGELRPAFELAFRWLGTHRPAPSGPDAVVHGDFRTGNLIIDPVDGIRAVLDWELVHRGDPLQDLGWLCVRAWRFGSAEPVGGFGAYRELFDAYERAGGRPVDPGAVRWWEVFGTLQWGVFCIMQARRHLDGTTRSVELAAIGRRVCEQEYDLLRLIEGR